jgi:hypothetical protein
MKRHQHRFGLLYDSTTSMEYKNLKKRFQIIKLSTCDFSVYFTWATKAYNLKMVYHNFTRFIFYRSYTPQNQPPDQRMT